MKKKHIIATVPQGIGDIFWIYQKLAPMTEKISFKIAMLYDNEIERRAVDVISKLPGVVSVETQIIDSERYHPLMYGQYSLADLLNDDADVIEIDYSLNYYLDNGIRLEEIDDLPVAYDVPLPMQPIDGIAPGYLLFFVSWASGVPETVERERLWNVQQWADLIRRCLDYGRPIYLTGANFDADVMQQIKCLVPEIELVIQPEPEKLFWLLGNCAAFVGYQSGLNVLADNLQRKQVHVFFDKLPLMRDSWAHPVGRDSRFKICFFSEGIDKAFRQVGELLGIDGGVI